MLNRKTRKVCFSLISRDSELTNIDVLRGLSGFIEVCRGSEAFVVVYLKKRSFGSFILFKIPENSLDHCKSIATALLNASLYPEAMVKEMRCPDV